MTRKLLSVLIITALFMALTACERTPPIDPNTCGPECVGGDHSECPIAIVTSENHPQLTEGRPVTEPPKPAKEIPFPGYTPTDHEMRDIPSSELVKEIQTGWNLGNTFDAPHETAWHNPETTFTMINTVKQAGFDSVRLPVSWGVHTGGAPDYEISEQLMDRVEEVVGYVLALDMYCILNTHHERWLFPTEENEEQNTEQLVAMWKQICERFADYNERLIFESMNEPRLFGTENEWNGGTSSARWIVSKLNDAFIETVRAAGGNNPKRHLMIPGYAASAEFSAMRDLSATFPSLEDDDKVIASIHAYTPYRFALAEKGDKDWNPDRHQEEVDRLFDNIKELFLDKDIPVILGEAGARNRDDNLESRVEWTKYYFGKSRELKIPVYWWDNGLFEGTESDELFGLLDRHRAVFAYPEIVDAIMDN